MKNIFNAILDMVQYVQGQNNYYPNLLHIHVYQDGIEVETCCCNEYGSVWGNEDNQFIGWENIPNWVMKSLIKQDKTFIIIEEF